MSFLRKEKKENYTTIHNDLIQAEGLSYRAKGIAVFLLSKPNNWEIKIPYLARVGKEGEKAIRTAMQELAVYGFLMRGRVRDEEGRICTITHLADYPAYINVGTVERRINGYEPSTDLAVSDTSENQRSENRQVGTGEVLVNTDKTITDSVSNKRKKNNSAPLDLNDYRPPAGIDPLTRY